MVITSGSGAGDHRRALLAHLDRICAAPLERMVYALPGVRPPEPHQCTPSPRMTFITRGAKHLMLGDGARRLDLRMPAGSAIFMPPQGWTRPYHDSPRELIGVVFNREYTRFLWSRHDGRGPPHGADLWHHAPVTMRGAAAHLLQALCARARETRGAEPHQADLQLLGALVRLARDELARAPDERSGRARATWQALRDHVAEHHHLPLTRESLCATFGLHPNYLSTLFLEQGGESFARYLTRLRMERAAELVRAGGMSVAEVGAACGYQQPSYFIKVFRRFHRVTPGAF